MSISTCTPLKKHGTPCKARRRPERRCCFVHDPLYAAAVAAGRHRGGSIRRRRGRGRLRLYRPTTLAGCLSAALVEALHHPVSISTRRIQALNRAAHSLLRQLSPPRPVPLPPPNVSPRRHRPAASQVDGRQSQVRLLVGGQTIRQSGQVADRSSTGQISHATGRKALRPREETLPQRNTTANPAPAEPPATAQPASAGLPTGQAHHSWWDADPQQAKSATQQVKNIAIREGRFAALPRQESCDLRLPQTPSRPQPSPNQRGSDSHSVCVSPGKSLLLSQ